ncbi:hypothetical protein EPUS_03801 [Endocarpon pusillum Z07020]|uniref:Chromo domain-containing protein n=1 Tax=Endocarpon pusillum (strain Z07020 / HMAS-L-300199) TaxID=1263415 RepID=U1G934_ENDPU|nr:uncharacterized protein EPUS_03801 [Endocarpon pusillum Z07020]ERF73987.1 hypothetical protein EPUS_03801 [Endocarpon pusillum Z07020]
MAHEQSLSAEESISDDAIFIDSTGSEEEGEYVVEAILAERVAEDSSPRYLVKWEGYGEERCGIGISYYPSSCTWEPADHFLNCETLQDWSKNRDAGAELSDDLIEKIITKINTYHDAKAVRKAQRQHKRRRLAARPVRLSSESSTASVPAAASHKKQGTENQGPLALTPGTRSLESAKRRRLLVTNQDLIPLKAKGDRADRSVQATTTQPPVFHGFSIGSAKRSGYSARRTGNQRASNTTNFRNLRHMNNARKLARRERSPDVTKIKLRSLAEWAESVPEDTNVQLPPAPASSIYHNESILHPSVNSGHSTIRTLSDSHVSVRPTSDLLPTTNPTHSSNTATSLELTSRKDMRAHNRFDPFEGQEKKLRTLANGRFFYFPGEILLDIQFGNGHIGDVRISGLPPWAFGPIIKLKQGNKLTLEIGSNDVVTLAQWAELCTGHSNHFQRTGVIIPFQDTADQVIKMEDYLHQYTLAALWYHPTEDITLVFYSPRSEGWMFLERMGGLPFDDKIRVLTRNRMPPTKMLPVARNTAAGNPASATVGALQRPLQATPLANPTPNDAADDVTASDGLTECKSILSPFPFGNNCVSTTAHSSDPGLRSENKLPTPERRSHLNAQPSLKGTHTIEDATGCSVLLPSGKGNPREPESLTTEAYPGTFRLPLQAGQAIGEAFQNAFRISYKHLTAVPPSKHIDRNPAKARFFLVYPSAAQAELDSLQKFLRSYTFHTNICTSMDERGWDAFRNIFNGDHDIGVILFHDDCTHYHALPRLASLLRSASFNVFRISLARPLRCCDDMSHIERLFPSGMAILLTESALVSDGPAILKWYRHKKRGSTWKLVLPPNVKNWLRRKALQADVEGRERFIEMLQLVTALAPGFSALRHHSKSDGGSSSEAESLDSLSDSSEGPRTLLSPSYIPPYDRPPTPTATWSDETWKNHVLIEYFAGWAVAHASAHRKFVAISTISDKTYSKWGHIEVLTPEKFMHREGIRQEKQVSKLQP